MTPLERAARALARSSCPPGGEAQFPYVSADEWEAKNWGDHVDAARAVLTAIRGPSEGMQTAGYGECHHPKDIPEHIWQTMIDTALAEG